MSWSISCVLPWAHTDIERVRAAIEAAIQDCAAKWPAYAKTRVEVDTERGHVHVHFPAELVQKPGWEIEPPTIEPADDGTYACTFGHYFIEADLENDYPGECGLTFRSNVSCNREAWMTATKVLERVTTML